MSNLFDDLKKKMPSWFDDPTNILLIAVCMEIIASIILSLSVVLVHTKLKADLITGDVVPDDKENAQNIILYICIAVFLVSFCLAIYAQVKEHSDDRKVRYIMERHFGIDFSDIRGVTEEEVTKWEKEKDEGYSIRRAKDSGRRLATHMDNVTV